MSTHVSSGPEPVQSITVSVLGPDVTATLEMLSSAIAAYSAEMRSAEAGAHLANTRREAAQAVSGLLRRDSRHPAVNQALEAIRALQAAGAYEESSSASDARLASSFCSQGWPGVLAAMLLAPSWHCPAAQLLEKVPDWLWGDYAAWLFAAPEGFSEIGDAERYAAHVLRHLEELARWVGRNLGSPSVQAAGKAYLRFASGIPLYFSSGSLKRHAELRGQVLTRLLARETTPHEPTPFSRIGRRLRVGFVNRHFGSQTETYTTLPTFEQLDPERFETILFSIRAADTPLAEYCRSRAQEFHVLPGELEGQLTTLREANLDVVVFGTNVTAVAHEVTRLALHRVAPLQVVNNSSCITSGLPHIDLYVSGTLTESETASAHFSERLGLLSGPAHAFDYEQDRHEPVAVISRATFGLPEGAPVFVSAANYYKITPEMQITWARLLARVPGSYLLVHPFNPNWSSTYPIQRFTAAFQRVLAAHDVDPQRLIVSSTRFPSRTDVKTLLSVGDVYLDSFPFGGVNSLVDPLELGMPVIAWEGETFRSRMGAALLRDLRLTQLIVSSEDTYLELASRLATDAELRGTLREAISQAMESLPSFLDPLAASDSFGRLLEAAYDEITDLGRENFRRQKTPLFTPTDVPLTAAARQLHAAELLASGRTARAVDYLVAAVTTAPTDAHVWFELARALRENNQHAQAVQALETCLRLDGSRIAGWEMMADLADCIGAHDIALEARQVVEGLPPPPTVEPLPDFTPAHLRLDN